MELKDWLEDNILVLVPLCQTVANNYGTTLVTPEEAGGEDSPLWLLMLAAWKIAELVDDNPVED